MILEVAVMTIKPGEQENFLAALEQARAVLAQASGWRSLAVHTGIERPDSVLLAIGWQTLEDHTVGFRGGELFIQWRAILGPYFAAAPEVEHWLEVS